jgi:endo-1,4-beta-xylanase
MRKALRFGRVRQSSVPLVSILLGAGVWACLLSGAAMAQPAQQPQPHAGWKLVPGGEDLIGKGYWGTQMVWTQPPDTSTFSVSGDVLSSFSPNYFGSYNPTGPWLSTTTGNFGVTAVIQTGPNLGGFVTLAGGIPTSYNNNTTQGLLQVEFGVNLNGDYTFYYWYGSPTANSVIPFGQTLKAGTGQPPVGQVTVEFLRQNSNFMLYFNGTPYGPFTDPGVFPNGFAMPGFQIVPGQSIKLSQFALEVPQSDTTSQIVEPVGVVPVTHTGPTPGSLAAVSGRSFGIEVASPELALGLFNSSTGAPNGAPNTTLGPKIIGQFSTLANFASSFQDSEPTQGDFVFDEADALIATAKATGRAPVYCHGLLHGLNANQPDWMVNGKFTASQLTQILQTYIQTVMGHFKGECESWTVINETLGSDGSLNTNNVYYQTLGPTWVNLAFTTARQADPNAKLYLVDYQIENSGPKADGMYALVSSLKAAGVPIDGVGWQSHWSLASGSVYSPVLSQMVSNMARLATLGLLVRETELDVALTLPASAADLASQAIAYSTSVQACLQSPNCVGINVFDVDDAMSWINGSFPGEGAATMFDANFNPKPAYTSVMDTLSAATPAKSAITKVNTSSGGTAIAQNTYVEIKGVNLVPATTPANGVIWSTAPSFASGLMPTQLNGVSVTVNGKPAFVYFYCSVVTSPACTLDQINVLTPLDNTTGPVQIVVTSGSTVTDPFTVTMNAVAPTLLLFNPLGAVVATHANATYSLAGSAALYPGASTPATPGETVVLYGIGFGLPVNALVNGSATQSGSLPLAPVCQVGSSPAAVVAALISPGLYQLNLTIPASASFGDNAVTCSYNSVSTPAGAFITVQ